jgi:hypothetical protein
MATQLFLREQQPTCHTSHVQTGFSGIHSWDTWILDTVRGNSLSVATGSTVAGPTAGREVQFGNGQCEWISEPLAADITISGTITCNLWASENNMSANVAINVAVDRLQADGTITNILKTTRTTEVAVTTRAVNNFTGTPTSTAFLKGDRIRVRVFGDDAGTMANGFTFNMGFDGATAAADGDSYVTFTENITFQKDTGIIGFWGEAVTDAPFGRVTNQQINAQSFVAQGTQITEVMTWLRKHGSPSDDAVLTIQTESGGNPTGTVVGTVATVSGASLTTTNTLYTYTGLSIAVTAGVTYFLVWDRSGSTNDTDYYSNGTGTAGDPWKVNATVGGSSHFAEGRIRNSGSWSGLGSTQSFCGYVQFNGTTLFLTDTAGPAVGAGDEREMWTSRGGGVTTATRTSVTGGPLAVPGLQIQKSGTDVTWYSKPLQAFTLSGIYVCNIREDGAQSQDGLRVTIGVCNEDGSSEVIWGTSMAAKNLGNVLVTGQIDWVQEGDCLVFVAGDDLAVTDGQRLFLRLYADDDSANPNLTGGGTATIYYAGTGVGLSGDTWIKTTNTLLEFVAGGGPETFPYVGGGYFPA